MFAQLNVNFKESNSTEINIRGDQDRLREVYLHLNYAYNCASDNCSTELQYLIAMARQATNERISILSYLSENNK
jgi:hypothetical protein